MVMSPSRCWSDPIPDKVLGALTMTKKYASYNAEMVAGALLERESRVIAQLLLDGADDKDWSDHLLRDNVLQKRSIKTIKRQASLIRHRIEPLGKDAWKLVAKGSAEVTRQMLLVACIKHNRLFGDFVLNVVRERYKTSGGLLLIFQHCDGISRSAVKAFFSPNGGTSQAVALPQNVGREYRLSLFPRSCPSKNRLLCDKLPTRENSKTTSSGEMVSYTWSIMTN